MHLNFKLNGNDANSKVTIEGNKYTLRYHCDDTSQCSNYEVDLIPGYYFIQLYGASGGYKEDLGQYISSYIDKNHVCYQENVTKYGGNTVCSSYPSMPGAGGYTQSTMILRKKTKAFIAIGGKGQYLYPENDVPDRYGDQYRPKGGYNGGAKGSAYYSSNHDFDGSSSGGGATDIRLEKDDYWHRIIVAGGGGGTDNYAPDNVYMGGDDGRGGAGGGLIAQGFWIDGVYCDDYVATQTSGFSFGNGEAAQKEGSLSPFGKKTYSGNSDRAGAGGGWFGGFSSHDGNGGASGGSSFAFTDDTYVTNEKINVYDEYYNLVGSDYYAFYNNSRYFSIVDPVFVSGIRQGNGKAIITYYPYDEKCPYLSYNCEIYGLKQQLRYI